VSPVDVDVDVRRLDLDGALGDAQGDTVLSLETDADGQEVSTAMDTEAAAKAAKDAERKRAKAALDRARKQALKALKAFPPLSVLRAALQAANEGSRPVVDGWHSPWALCQSIEARLKNDVQLQDANELQEQLDVARSLHALSPSRVDNSVAAPERMKLNRQKKPDLHEHKVFIPQDLLEYVLLQLLPVAVLLHLSF
jgi:hypothetical protein